jgi:flagellar hook-associated protein 1
MSMFSPVLNSALSSILANQYALQIASNNIANANNPNYTRQRLMTRPSGTDGGAYGIGMGVDIIGVEALRDRLVETRYRHAVSDKAGADTLAGRLSDIEAIFNDANGGGLSKSITDFFNSFQELSQDPASTTLREQVKVTANALVSAIHTKDAELKKAKAASDKAIAWDVGQINQLTGQIAKLTSQIKAEELSTTAHDLRDARGALIKELSQYMEVNELDSGDYQLTTKDGRLLVMNNVAQPLALAEVTPELGEGSLRAELNTRDTYVPKYAAALDQLAFEIAEQVNTLHAGAYDLDGNTNINFFGPLTSATDAARLINLSTDVAGNTRRIAASSLPTGNDNGAAKALGNLLYAPVFSGGSVTDQYSALVFNIGSDTASANAGVDEQTALLTQLEARRQSLSGVSIDEESLQITQFQRAYQASAQLMNVVDELLQVTLGMVG